MSEFLSKPDSWALLPCHSYTAGSQVCLSVCSIIPLPHCSSDTLLKRSATLVSCAENTQAWEERGRVQVSEYFSSGTLHDRSQNTKWCFFIIVKWISPGFGLYLWHKMGKKMITSSPRTQRTWDWQFLIFSDTSKMKQLIPLINKIISRLISNENNLYVQP